MITRMNVGGPALQAIALTSRLDPERFETVLAAGEPDPFEGDMAALRGARIGRLVRIPLQRDISPLSDLRALAQLVGVVRSFRPHIVHTHMAKAGLLGRVAARLGGVPIVVHTFHGNVLRGYFDPFRSGLFLALERVLARMSTRIVAISGRQRDELRRMGIAREPRLIELPLGIDLSSFLDAPRGALRRELGIGNDDPLVGIVARLVPVKAVDVFIDAIAILVRSDPRLRAVVIGDGELRASLAALARARLPEERLRFLGWRADLPAVYGDLDVVALTSENEGTPVTVLEALAAARAVVATDVGGVADLLGADERGLLVPPRSPERVAAAIAELLADPERRVRLGEAGRAYVFPAYDVDTLVARVERLYIELVAGRRS